MPTALAEGPIKGELVDSVPAPPSKPDNCPYCGVHYQAGPEGDTWNLHFHCWACGFDPNRIQGVAGGALPAVVSALPEQFAAQLAAEVHAALGLAPGENLGDVIATIRNAQPAVPAASSSPGAGS